jgi:hypothetical protein
MNRSSPPPAAIKTHVGFLESSSGVGVVVGSETTISATDTVPTCMFAATSAWLRLSDVTADVTDINASGATITTVSTAMVCASRRRPSVCSVTFVICTAESTTLSALATPDMYSMRTAGMNESLLIKRVAVNAIDTLPPIDAQEAEPVVGYVPASQGVHADAPAVEYFPAPQVVHSDAPAVGYVPAPQGVHSDAPVAEYFPAPQGVHVDAPTVSVYVPATQGVHVDAPVVENFPAPQGVHVDAPVVE